MNKKSYIVTFIILTFLSGLPVISIHIGSPQNLWRAKNYTDSAVQKFDTIPTHTPTQVVSSIQQEERMRPTPTSHNKTPSQDLVRNQENIGWRIYTKTSHQFSYRVEYPSNWSVEENGNTAFFIPPHAKSKQESISIVVINYKKTSPLPVQYMYTTIRTIQVDDEEIFVRNREPSPVTEKYFTEIKKGDYVAEFRFSLDHQYDDVFDHMLSTFSFVE